MDKDEIGIGGKRMNRHGLDVGLALLLWIAALTSASGEEPNQAALENNWQSRIEERYREFEATLERTADLLRPTEPDRAALLARAFSQSRRDLILVELKQIIDQMNKGELHGALAQQEDVIGNLRGLLDLLLSEDKSDQRAREQEEITARLRELERLSGEQRRLRAKTEQDEAPKGEGQKLSEAQGKLADQAKGEREKSPTNPSNPDPQKSPASPMPEQPPEGKQEEPSSPSKSSPPRPGDSNLEAAEKAMRDAKSQLDQNQRPAATKKQDEALEELRKATEEAEEKLRQLREEERQEILADLQARITKILEQQKAIHDTTSKLAAIPASDRTRLDDQKAVQLSRKEEEVVRGLDAVLAILIEDGTAIAFPETIEQSARDAERVVTLLAKGETGPLTLKIEQDIIDTLSDLATSLAKEMKKKGAAPPEEGQPGGGGKSPLIERLAELKMVRALQKRIHERTIDIDKTGDTLSESDRGAVVNDLADRQHRVYEITRGIAEGPGE